MTNTNGRPTDLDTWLELEPYLDQALELEGVARERWLSELAQTRADIVEALRELLREHEEIKSAGFLSDAVLPSPAFGPLTLGSDQIIGPYRLFKEIGHGGMSSVWLARRSDEQLKRDVALKLPLVGHRVPVERFKRERDLLAALTHPNIARLYDAGVTENGQPYLAMEYIDGMPITKACDLKQTGLRERLRLFLQVLEAVQFAHAQLIIHRDLKPSNILVTDEGRVVLLDFGIGKLIGTDEQDAQLTEMFGRPLTLDYASPEQLTNQPLGTASDIYSLGVILYELLTGTHPHRDRAKHQTRAAMEDAVLSGDVRPPSQSSLPEAATITRRTSRRALHRALTGDLDTILVKALKRTPSERYASASAFAQDISNHLQRLPISARPDSFWYRSARFIARHRMPVAAASFVVAALVGGTGIALWQAHRAAAERDRASILVVRNDATVNFLSALITEAAASSTPVTVSDMLARSEALIDRDPEQTDENRAAVLSMLGSYYLTLGNTKRSEELHRRALTLMTDSTDVDLRSRIACAHALTISNLGMQAQAREELDAQIALADLTTFTRGACFSNRAGVAKKDGDAAATLKYAQAALEQVHLTGPGHSIDEAQALAGVAVALNLNGQRQEARRYYEMAMDKYRSIGREHDVAAQAVRSNRAIMESATGNPLIALQLYDEVTQTILARDPNAHVPSTLMQNRGRMMQVIGRYDEARTLYEAALKIAESEGNSFMRSQILLKLASVAEDLGERHTAAKYLTQADAVIEASLPPNSPVAAARTLARAKLHVMDGQFSTAIEEFDSLLKVSKADNNSVDAALGKAEAELLNNDARAAAADARFALETARTQQGDAPFSYRTGLASLTLASAQRALGETDQARTSLNTAVEHLSQTVDASHPGLIQARQMLVRAEP